MTKQTKTLAMVAVLGVGAYLVYKNWMKQKAAAAPKASYVGKVGNRQRGLTNEVKVADSGWKKGQTMANKGGNGAPSAFFDTRSSKWGNK